MNVALSGIEDSEKVREGDEGISIRCAYWGGMDWLIKWSTYVPFPLIYGYVETDGDNNDKTEICLHPKDKDSFVSHTKEKWYEIPQISRLVWYVGENSGSILTPNPHGVNRDEGWSDDLDQWITIV